MSTHNIGFYEDLTKIIFQISSITHLVSSADSTARSISPNSTCHTVKRPNPQIH